MQTAASPRAHTPNLNYTLGFTGPREKRLAASKKKKKQHEQRRQLRRPSRAQERRLWMKIALQLVWIVAGFAAIFYWLSIPEKNWLVPAIWVVGSLLWGLHTGLRWLFTYLEGRKATRR